MCPTCSFICQIFYHPSSLDLSENRETTGLVNKVITLSRVPVPQCGVTRAETHLAHFPAAFSNISRNSFWLKIKAIITIVSIPGWVTLREQNILVARDQNTLSMKICSGERAGIASLDEVSRVRSGACAAGAHQAASLGTKFLF